MTSPDLMQTTQTVRKQILAMPNETVQVDLAVILRQASTLMNMAHVMVDQAMLLVDQVTKYMNATPEGKEEQLQQAMANVQTMGQPSD